MRSNLLSRFTARTLVVASLTLFAAACGGDNNGPADDGNGPTQNPSDDGETRLRMTNQSSTSAWYIYVRSCGTENWGPDRLGSSNVLSPGESTSWTTSAPGCYDIRATGDPDSNDEATWMGVNIASAQTTQVNIQDGDWQ